MKRNFSHDFMYNNRGCYSYHLLNNCSFMQGNGPVTLADILKSEIPTKDKFWFVWNKAASQADLRELSIGLAKLVLPIWEGKHPDDHRPRNAIKEAKKIFLKGGRRNSSLFSYALEASSQENNYAIGQAGYAAARSDGIMPNYPAAINSAFRIGNGYPEKLMAYLKRFCKNA